MRLRRSELPPRRRATVSAIILASILVTGCGTRNSAASVPIPRSDRSTPDRTDASDSIPDLTRVAESDVADVESDPGTSDHTDTDPADPPATTRPAPTTTSTSTSTSTTTTTTTTTLPPAVAEPPALADASFTATAAVFDRLARANAGASLTVVRGGVPVVRRAAGPTVDGSAATSDSPMVVASVSKIIVAMGIARLHELGSVDVSAPVPWGDLGLGQNPAWNDVTVRELLDHTGGVPKVQASWFTGEGTCRDFVPSLLASPPSGDRGTWVYSNGNYCILGLLIEQATGEPLDVALQRLVFDPVGATGIHLTDGGLLPGDLPHAEGTDRLSRLGGAGTLVVSTDDLATVFAHVTPADWEILRPPGVFIDQYGFGHTGTVTGAKSCVWVLEGGATVVAATIAGNSVSSGGDLCDIVVPAVASDVGLGSAQPDRIP